MTARERIAKAAAEHGWGLDWRCREDATSVWYHRGGVTVLVQYSVRGAVIGGVVNGDELRGQDKLRRVLAAVTAAFADALPAEVGPPSEPSWTLPVDAGQTTRRQHAAYHREESFRYLNGHHDDGGVPWRPTLLDRITVSAAWLHAILIEHEATRQAGTP